MSETSKPNEKGVIDITYIHTGQGKRYYSVIKNLSDNPIISYRVESNMYFKLVLDNIKDAAEKEKVANGRILHNDQGFQHTSHGYFSLAEQYGI